ncbi:hypothetical protein TNCV_4212221 [Trichonephila clavipes]|nr:hypothetical protein TNCV_4212221 [Trichonephila clavipes]
MANNQSVRRHLDAFTRGRIIGKLEEGRSVTSGAAEFGIAHSIVSRLWRHRNWRDNEWGRVLFTDESRFSLSSDSHRILIWREREATIIPRTSLKGTGIEVTVFSFGEASCLVVVQTFTASTQVQSTGPVIVTRFFFHMCVF